MNISDKKIIIPVAFAAILIIVFFAFKKIEINPPAVQDLTLLGGFKIETYADKLSGPRVMEFDGKGRILVSQTEAGNVLVIEDKNKDGSIQDNEKSILLGNLKSPHGLAFFTDKAISKTYLYIAETNQVNRYVYDADAGKITGKGENIAKLPDDGKHFTRTIAFGPNFRKEPILSGPGNDKGIDTLTNIKLYISIGSSCNVCVEDTWKRAAILESDPEGNYMAEFAGGLRNSVFFTFNPNTKEIWATEMGRDNLGDNLPPDEINIIKAPDKSDQFGAKRYGWPFCYGNQVKDTNFNPGKYSRTDLFEDCSKTVAPVIEIPAHSAPLGLAFIDSKLWPSEWQNNLLVAYHGSDDGQKTRQPKIVRFKIGADGRPVGTEEDFITGWHGNGNPSTSSGQEKYGRPVDLKFGPNGALYVTDDVAGEIYRIEYIKD